MAADRGQLKISMRAIVEKDIGWRLCSGRTLGSLAFLITVLGTRYETYDGDSCLGYANLVAGSFCKFFGDF